MFETRPHRLPPIVRPNGRVRLDRFSSARFERGRSRLQEATWRVVQAAFVSSFLPGSRLRAAILRAFGARIGRGVVFKPRLRVTFPWRLEIGDHCWIGENVWIDNLAQVRIGDQCCVSQDVYLCTGSHDWTKPEFDLILKPIAVADQAWLAARSSVAPGATIGQGAVLAFGAVAFGDLAPWTVHQGNPAQPTRRRALWPERSPAAGRPLSVDAERAQAP